MSSALAISGVTAVLQYSLNSIYNPGAGLGSVTVSAIAPDLVPTDVGGNGSDTLQVNLFLHQVTPNQVGAMWASHPWLQTAPPN